MEEIQNKSDGKVASLCFKGLLTLCYVPILIFTASALYEWGGMAGNFHIYSLHNPQPDPRDVKTFLWEILGCNSDIFTILNWLTPFALTGIIIVTYLSFRRKCSMLSASLLWLSFLISLSSLFVLAGIIVYSFYEPKYFTKAIWWLRLAVDGHL